MISESQRHETDIMLGRAAMSPVGGEHKIAWAMSLVEQGVMSEALIILAGLSHPMNNFEIEDFVNRALRELSIERPNPTGALLRYAKALALEVIREERPAEAAVVLICEVNTHLNHPDELSRFPRLSDQWFCEHMEGWSEERRREEIVRACHELVTQINDPTRV